MYLLKLGDCWINPKHICCANIKERFDIQKEKNVCEIFVYCYGNEVACMQYDHREDAETVLRKVILKAMEESDK